MCFKNKKPTIGNHDRLQQNDCALDKRQWRCFAHNSFISRNTSSHFQLLQSKSFFTAPARLRREECWTTDWSRSFSRRDTESVKLAWAWDSLSAEHVFNPSYYRFAVFFFNILFWVVIPTLPSAKELEASSFVESFDQSLSTLSSSWSSLLLKKARTGKLLFYLPNYEIRKNTLNVGNHYNHLHVPEERAS